MHMLRAAAAADRSVQFTVDGTTTYGTLHVPAHRGGQHLAAALLLAGSGPTDRNGDDAAAGLEPHTLQLIAGVLGRSGIMTLRFDKYFSGQTGAGAYAGHPSAIDLAAFIRQADAAYDFLRAQPAADPRRMLVAGHSEGGMYALLVAESVAPRPAGLALIEPPGVAARLPHGTRVLVTEGTDDLNVPPSTITPLVRALAAAGTTGPGLRLLSGVNHLLHPAGTADDDQVLAPSVVAALQAWAQAFLASLASGPL